MRRQCQTALTVMFLGVISLGYLANVAFLGGGTVSDVASENRRATAFPTWHGVKAKRFCAEYDKYLNFPKNLHSNTGTGDYFPKKVISS